MQTYVNRTLCIHGNTSCYNRPVSAVGRPMKASACLLSWKRPRNMQRIVDHLRTFAFIDDIVIWNNGAAPMSVNGKDVHVIQSDRNRGGYGRYLCTAFARHDVIFTQDDDWLALDAPRLFAAFCEDPSRLAHGLTREHYERRERFRAGNAHAALMGFGGVFHREWVRVLDPYAAKFGEDDLLRRQADWMFPMLLGRPHTVLFVRAEPLPGATGLESLWVAPAFWEDIEEAERRVFRIIGGGGPETHIQNDFAATVRYTEFVVVSPEESDAACVCRMLAGCGISGRGIVPGRDKAGWERARDDPRVAKVFLRRRNVVWPYVLRQAPCQSLRSGTGQVRIDAGELLAHCDRLGNFLGYAHYRLHESGQKFRTVFTEDLCGDERAKILEGICAFIGASPQSAPPADSRPEHAGHLSEYLENYEELAADLRGTVLEEMIV